MHIMCYVVSIALIQYKNAPTFSCLPTLIRINIPLICRGVIYFLKVEVIIIQNTSAQNIVSRVQNQGHRPG
jgi:hypothetical protein